MGLLRSRGRPINFLVTRDPYRVAILFVLVTGGDAPKRASRTGY